MCVWEKGSLFVWFFDICGLQFGMVREVYYCLVLVLRFGDLLSLGALQLLDLICGSLFGLCAIRIWYLWTFGFFIRIWFFGFVFVNLWFFDSYLVLWFCICERELFGCIWDLGLWEYLYTNFIIPNLL